MEAAAGAPVVLGSSRLRDLEREYPQDSDFRQSNDFFYLTGLETPDAWLVLNLPTPGSEVLYLEPRDPAQELWTGEKLGPGSEARARSGLADVRSSDRLVTDVTGWLGQLEAPAVYIDPGDPAHVDRLGEALGEARGTARQLGPTLAELRMIKDRDELRRLREAVRITTEAHQEAWRAAGAGMHEYEVEALIEYVFRSRGAERVGFPSIVGSAENSVTLHYDKNRRMLQDGDLVVVDIGAEFGYYTADLTRTFPVSGQFTDRQRAVYELVLSAQEAALAEVRPGATVGRLEQAARRYMREHSGDLCGGESCAAYFPHGISHWLGMDVHDVGNYGTTLAPGMVLTIEPGIYLPDESLGVRIEDNVLVTEDGYELLSGSLPRRPEEVERIMSEAPRIWSVAGKGS
jgi:Xaa-Pro aminopeptidase